MEGDTTFGDGRETNIQRKSQEGEAADITSVTFFTRGVMQGSIFRPTLFRVTVNDVVDLHVTFI